MNILNLPSHQMKDAIAKKLLLTLVISLGNFLPVSAQTTSQGLITYRSDYSTSETIERFKASLAKRKLTLFATIDHQLGAKNTGQELLPTQLIIFGNPKVGTPLMQCNRNIAIDLPQKALIWQDRAGRVWLAYNNPQYLMDRHNLDNCQEEIAKIEVVLKSLAVEATDRRS